MVAGGTESGTTPMTIGAFAQIRALSTKNDSPESACSPFDKDRDGFVMAEGSTVLVLEEKSQQKNVVQKFTVMSLDMDLLRMLIIYRSCRRWRRSCESNGQSNQRCRSRIRRY